MVGPLRETNIPGGCQLQLVAADRIGVFPAVVRGTIPSVIPLLSGSWDTIVPTRFTQQFAEDWTLEAGAKVSVASVKAIIPKDRVVLLENLWDLGRQRFVVLHYDMNGTVKVLGTKSEPATVRVVKLDHGSKLGSDRNQYELQITIARREKCPFYLAAPPVAPVPGSCAPVAIYDYLGGQIALVASGGSYQLPNTNTNCPTLAQLVAALPNMYELMAVLSEAQVEQLTAILLQGIDEVDGGAPDTDHENEVGPIIDDGDPPPDSIDFDPEDFDPDEFA